MLRSISITHMRVQERGERSKDLGLGRGELFRRDYILHSYEVFIQKPRGEDAKGNLA